MCIASSSEASAARRARERAASARASREAAFSISCAGSSQNATPRAPARFSAKPKSAVAAVLDRSQRGEASLTANVVDPPDNRHSAAPGPSRPLPLIRVAIRSAIAGLSAEIVVARRECRTSCSGDRKVSVDPGSRAGHRRGAIAEEERDLFRDLRRLEETADRDARQAQRAPDRSRRGGPCRLA